MRATGALNYFAWLAGRKVRGRAKKEKEKRAVELVLWFLRSCFFRTDDGGGGAG